MSDIVVRTAAADSFEGARSVLRAAYAEYAPRYDFRPGPTVLVEAYWLPL